MNKQKFNMSCILSSVILLVTFSYLQFYQPIPVDIDPNVFTLPDKVDKWSAEAAELEKEKPFKVNGADLEIWKTYERNGKDSITVYRGYFSSQGKDKELINYKFEWLYRNAEQIEVPLSMKDSHKIKKTSFTINADSIRALYWYDLNGKLVSDNLEGKIITIVDGLFKKRTNGAIIIVYSILNQNDQEEHVVNNQIEFVQKLIPLLSSVHS